MPAAATAALLLLAVLQLGWSRPLLLPPPDAIAPVRLVPVPISPVAADPLHSHTPFSAGQIAAAAVQPLEGAHAVGVIVRAGRATAFVQAAGGGVTRLGAGQAYAGWRLVGIGTDELRFRRGGESAILPIGGGPSATTSAAPPAQPGAPR